VNRKTPPAGLAVKLNNGETPPFALPESESKEQSVFAFSMAKAGSTLLFNLLHELTPCAGMTYFAPSNALWSERGRGAGALYDMSGLFRRTGYCYGGFRLFPAYDIPILRACPAIILVRDPKDMLVSNYFSNAFSHRPPTDDEESEAYRRFMERRERIQNTDINDYVRTIMGNCQKMFASYRGYWRHKRVKVFRYEDIIERKRPWVDEIMSHYGWRIPDATIDEVIARNDVFPDAEKKDAHVRQVKPGNYKQHLNKATITLINNAFSEDLAILGYDQP